MNRKVLEDAIDEQEQEVIALEIVVEEAVDHLDSAVLRLEELKDLLDNYEGD